MNRASRNPALAVLAVFLSLWALAGAAQAQWAWRDAAGNITYSDTPPPPDVAPGSILRQPTAMPAPEPAGSNSGAGGNSAGYRPAGSEVQGANAAGGAPARGAEAPRPAAGPSKTLAEQEAEFRKRNADREKAAQKAEQEEAEAARKAEACAQARNYLEMIQGGTRLMRPDADGNRSFMDEEQRAAETQKTQDNIAKSCS